MSKLTIYHASAGSGKTYRITGEYLKLLFRNPYNYKYILAVTFTNKATAEMKNRIVSELFRIASGKGSGYLDSLQNITGMNTDKIRELADDILRLILHDFSRFFIMTIDTFYQGIIRSFARETGFQTLYNIELDNIKVLEHAVENLIKELDKDSELRNWLVMFSEDRIESGKSWNLIHDLMHLGNEIFRENYRMFTNDSGSASHDKKPVLKFLSQLKTIKSEFETFLSNKGMEALNLMKEHSLEPGDFFYGNSGFASYFRKIASFIFEPPGNRAIDAVDNPEKWFGKTSDKQGRIRKIYKMGLNSLLKHAIEYYNNNSLQYNTAVNLLKNIHSLAILTDISRKVTEYTRENNSFLLAGSQFFLQKVIAGNDAPFIYEKTGSQFKHFMIDEFQDTSVLQWNNFKPLIINSLSEHNLSMIVGDVKQSIYRWRNGDWRLLAGGAASDFSGFGADRNVLDFNRRSKKNIVDFNNCIFYYASVMLQDHLNSAISGCNRELSGLEHLSDVIRSAYIDSFQKIPGEKAASSDNGNIKVSFINKNEGIPWDINVLEKLPAVIEELQDSNFMLRDIAILVRRKDEGKQVADFMIRYKNSENAKKGYRYDLISNEALFIENSSTVQFILQVLKFVTKPDDMVNCAALLHNYYCNIMKSGRLNDIIFSSVSQLSVRELLSEKFPDYKEACCLPVYEIVEEIIRAFGLNKNMAEVPFLQEFQNIVLEYSVNEPVDPACFLEWWEEEGEEKSVHVSEMQDAIRVLTIHKAKGLEFKVVIIPFCDWPFDHDSMHATILWCKPDTAPFNEIDILPVQYSSRLRDTIFYRDYFVEKMQAYVDNLNLMYVAFTRAIHSLYIFAPLPAKPESFSRTGDLLFRIFTGYQSFPVEVPDESAQFIELGNYWNSDKALFILGDTLKTEPGTDYDSNPLPFILSEYPSSGFEKKLLIRENSRNFFSNYSESVKQQIDYGRMMHGVFSEIITSSDIDMIFKRIMAEGKITHDEYRLLKEQAEEILNNEVISDWYSGKWKVRNESPILAGTGKLKVPDRILTDNEKAIIIEYKFGETKQPHHLEQVQEYISILSSMGYSEVKGYVWYFSLNEIIDVR